MKREQEMTLSEFEQAWEKSSYESGLGLFEISHASAANSIKADSSDLIIWSDLDEILQPTKKKL